VYYGLTINLPVTQGIVVYVVAFGYIVPCSNFYITVHQINYRLLDLGISKGAEPVGSRGKLVGLTGSIIQL